jgi:hypothetical protein
LARRPHSQACLCPYTPYTVTVRAEQTFERLRYILGGNRPSQTARQALSPALLAWIRTPTIQGWYFTDDSTQTGVQASKSPTYATQEWPRPNAKLQ